MKGTELVLKALKDNGVQYIFGYTGGAIMPIFDEMEKQKKFDFIMSRHEQGAEGVSRASLSTPTPQVGVCMATSGPGAMNMVTGIADAGMDSRAFCFCDGLSRCIDIRSYRTCQSANNRAMYIFRY